MLFIEYRQCKCVFEQYSHLVLEKITSTWLLQAHTGITEKYL